MSVHDWTNVEAGIFHAFHQQWIIAISNALNNGTLPPDYYALPEQHAAGFGPDVLTLQGSPAAPANEATSGSPDDGRSALLIAEPRIDVTAETDMEFYRRKQTLVVVRHVSGDRVVAMIEIVSPGNKSTRHAFRSLIEKAAELLDQRIHLLLIDLLPPGPRDPRGLHSALWDEIAGQEYVPPVDKSLTLAAYETALTIRAYVKPIAVGDSLPEMPLFLEPNGCVQAPLDPTYQTAFSAMPARWRRVLEPQAG
jgi:Protein of unknown function (DUF4058)